MSGAPVSRWAAMAARSTFFSFSVHGYVVPISPSRPERTPVSPTPTVTSRDHLAREIVDGAGRPCPADATRPRSTPMPITTLSPVARAMRASASGSRASVAGVGIDDRRAARVLEEQDLVRGDLLVGEPQVVEVRVEVLAHPAEVREADRLPRAALVARGRRLREHHLEVDQEVLVGQRHAHRVRSDRPEHRLHLAGP